MAQHEKQDRPDSSLSAHRSYSSSSAGAETYRPIPNLNQVKGLGQQAAEAYLKIQPYTIVDESLESGRQLEIVNDSVIRLEGHYAELFDDARFVFNALIHARSKELGFQSSSEICSYQYGLGNISCQPNHHNHHAAAQPLRAVNALDAFAENASQKIMIERTGWGSGSKPGYAIAKDIAIRDNRLSDTSDQ